MNNVQNGQERDEDPRYYINDLENVSDISDELKQKMINNIVNLVKKISFKDIKGSYTGFFSYQTREVFIKNLKNNAFILKTIYHELTHVSSSEVDDGGNIVRIGFHEVPTDFGKGLNESITEYVARKIFTQSGRTDSLKMYADLYPIASELVNLYRFEPIIDSYINGNNTLEKLMATDGKSIDELIEYMDDYYIAVHEDKKKIYDSPLMKPEVSGLYEKIGKFIEDIKEKRGIKDERSSWKIVHRHLLSIKSPDDYTINEIYSNYDYFSKLKDDESINPDIYSYESFDAKLIFVKGIREYKKAIDVIPGMKKQSDSIIEEVLKNVTTARFERYTRRDVVYDKVLKLVVFEKSVPEKTLISHMVAPLTRIAFNKELSVNNPYMGICFEKAKYVANEVMDIVDKVDEKNKNKTDYYKLITLFGPNTMLNLNEFNIEKIKDELSMAGVSDNFLEAYNVLNGVNANEDEKHRAEEIIDSSIKLITEYRGGNQEIDKWKNETRVNVPEKRGFFAWFHKIKSMLSRKSLKTNKTVLLNESNAIEQDKKDFISNIKVSENQFNPEFVELNNEQHLNKHDRERE